MKHVTLQHITISEVCYAEIVDGEHTLSFEQFVHASGQEAA